MFLLFRGRGLIAAEQWNALQNFNSVLIIYLPLRGEDVIYCVCVCMHASMCLWCDCHIIVRAVENNPALWLHSHSVTVCVWKLLHRGNDEGQLPQSSTDMRWRLKTVGRQISETMKDRERQYDDSKEWRLYEGAVGNCVKLYLCGGNFGQREDRLVN